MDRIVAVRRIACALFALALLHQSSGIALAAGAGMAQPGLSIRAQIVAALQSLQNTQIGAAVSGDAARWTAMHAAPPTIQHEAPPIIVPPDRHVNELRQFHHGVFVAAPPMLRRPLSPKDAPTDPRALRQSASAPIVPAPSKPCAVHQICTSQATQHRFSARTAMMVPTVQPFLFEADTTAGPSTPVFYTDGGKETGALSQIMDPAPTSASADETLSYAANSPAVSFGWVSPANAPNSTSWPAQTYTVTLNVTQSNSNLVITAVHILRVDSLGDGGGGDEGLSIVGEATGLSQPLNAGTLTFTVTGAAQTASVSDRIAVKIVLHNNSTSAQSFSYLAGQNSGSGVNIGNAPSLSANTTGVNPWWTYEEGTLPGHGKYMANVGNGNLLVQADDVDVPERGIDLAFRRTYNAQSTHDSNNSDGSVPGDYGDGWTNTFDAHLAYDGANTISVYDIDGARYDYTADGTGHWTAPPGQHATLTWDNGCGYEWTKKTGTIYYFWSPDMNESPTCAQYYPHNAAYGGRLYQILGRNHNNSITFTYAWLNGDSSNPSNLTQINATHVDGHALVLNFGAAVTGGPTELLSLTRPDGQVINYYYDSSGTNLQWVYRPGNNAEATLKESYGYNAAHQMHYATSPRYNLSSTDGDVTYFNYDSSNRLIKVYDWGLVNFVPGDVTATYLQTPAPASTPLQTWRTINFSGYGGGTTTMTDSNGHSSIWTIDSLSRVTQTQEFTGEASPTSLITSQTWDPNNNLTETVDARMNATDYAYDANGNTIAVALPSVTTNVGTFRPTSLYSYDAYNNVLAYCDAVKVGSTGYDWVNRPQSDTLCTVGAGATQYAWDTTDEAEPYGKLTNTYTPLGYRHTIAYDTSAGGGGDYGLPTSITGDPISQTDTSTPTRKPETDIAYDSYGNIGCYAHYRDTNNVVHWYRAKYDTLNRRIATADPDDGSLSVSQCTNTAGLTGSHIQSTTTYYNNNDVETTQTPEEYANGVATSFSYDADGDETSEVHHYNSVAGTTSKWYDGADRLVDVQQPADPNGHDYYSYAWITRYIYDLTQGGNVSVDGATFRAYGNLYKTEEYIPSSPIVTVSSGPSSPSWQDVRGTSFDALDRALNAYENSFGTTPKLSNTYDGSGYYGLLTQTQNAVGQRSVLTYYNTEWLYQKQYENDGGVTPALTYTYDPDGRPASVTSSQFGTEYETYDADGRLTQDKEPTGGGYTSPATITYDYYSDGTRKDVSITSSGFSQSDLFQYAYRMDGSLESQQVIGKAAGAFAWTYTVGGRELTQSDPYTNHVIHLYNGLDADTGQTRTLQPKTYGYDLNGRVTSLLLPEGYTYNQFTYDAEGGTTGYARSNAWCDYGNNGIDTDTTCVGGRSQTFSVRNELVSVSDSAAGATLGNGPSANGTIVTGLTTSFDARSGMVLGMTDKNFSNKTYTPTATLAYAHDVAGRQSTVTENYTYGTPQTAYATRAYDAENRIASQTYSGAAFFCADSLSMCGWQTASNYPGVSAGFVATYGYGPNGHPIMFGFQNGYQTPPFSVHWDGDDVLFEYGSGGFVVEIGKLGDINESTTNGFTVYDRDMTGAAVATHTTSAFSAWSSAPPTKTVSIGPLCHCQNEGSFVGGAINSNNDNYAPTTPNLSAGREDGYGDVYGNTFQGVRAYDENTGQWTAPDMYAGDVRDPMSQKPFMWNGNNPLQYADPSGYCLEDACVGETAAATIGVGELAVEGGAEVADLTGDTAAANSMRSGVASFNRAAWQQLEKTGDWIKGEFNGLGGRLRIADNLNRAQRMIGEAKSVSYQALTRQLKDYIHFAQDNKLTFVLRVWKGTKLSKPLQDAIKSGLVKLEEVVKPHGS